SLLSGTTGPRPSQGHMSWMATLVPKVDFNTIPPSGSDQFVLSVVIFVDRPPDLYLTTSNQNLLERTVKAYFPGDGSTGGEVLLYIPAAKSAANTATAAERLKLRANQWILLAGIQNGLDNSGTVVPIGRFQWYRVTHCDTEPEFVAKDTTITSDR